MEDKPYLTVNEWGELALIDQLLDDYILHSSPRKDPLYTHAISLRKKLLPALNLATDQIKI